MPCRCVLCRLSQHPSGADACPLPPSKNENTQNLEKGANSIKGTASVLAARRRFHACNRRSVYVTRHADVPPVGIVLPTPGHAHVQNPYVLLNVHARQVPKGLDSAFFFWRGFVRFRLWGKPPKGQEHTLQSHRVKRQWSSCMPAYMRCAAELATPTTPRKTHAHRPW